PSATAQTFKVTAKNTTTGATNTAYRGIVHFTSSDAQATLPANYTFTSTDAGVHTFTAAATLRTAPGPQSITATDTVTATTTGTQSGIVVSPGPRSTLIVSGFPSPVTAGVRGHVTVRAMDAANNTTPAYAGT